MSFSKRTLTVALNIGLISAFAVAVGSAPAQAIERPVGRALIRIDAPSATTSKVSNGQYVMTLPKESAGQWLAERPNARGKTKVAVGNITAEQVAKRWSAFQYSGSGVFATLVWTSNSEKRVAPVRLSQPTVTEGGISITVASGIALPETMTDLSINVRRAPGVKMRAFPKTSEVEITSNLYFSSQVPSHKSATTTLHDGSGKSCWTRTFQSGAMDWDQISRVNCGGVNTYGDVRVHFANDKLLGDLFFEGTLTPAGQASFHWDDYLLRWTTSGD